MPDAITDRLLRGPSAAKVLVVDDTEANRYAVVRHLQGVGYEIIEASTGRDGLDRARAEMPDLVILDIRLPDMNGFEVARQLRSDDRTVGIPILHISASFSDPQSLVRGLDNGADGYLTHPVEPAVMLASVKALLRVRSAEHEARATARAWRATFDAIDEGVCACDTDGRVIRCNRTFTELLDLTYDKVIGRELSALLPSAQKLPTPPFVRFGSEDAADGLFALESRWLRGSAAPITDDAGVTTGVVCVLADVTRQRATEERIRRSQQLETTGRLAGGVAHEINNLMTIILGYSSLMLRATIDPGGRTDLEHIHRAGTRAAEIARQLLTFSRRHFTRPTTVDLHALLLGMQRTLEQLLGVTRSLRIELGPEPLCTFIDHAELEQTIVNIVLNARDAMMDGGELTIRVQPVRLDAAFIASHPGMGVRDGMYAELAIADTGHGMDATTLTHMFEPFFTTKGVGAGTGLGLSMAYGVVKQADGYIWADSRLGEGTTITIHLPLKRPTSGMHPTAPLAPTLESGQGTVLVAEDESAVRQLIRRALETVGYDVLEAENGEEGARKFAEARSKIRLVLTDIVMPRMNGPALAKAVRASHPGLPILFMSGHTNDEIVHRQLLGPGEAFLQKPFATDDMVRQVQTMLRQDPAAL